MRRGTRHRWGPAVVVTTALALTVGSQGAAVALPRAAAAPDREFSSSFEADDPAPDWVNTVDTGPNGEKRAAGVDGGFSTGIPGNVSGDVTGVRASGENTGGGEVKENLVDTEPATKWLTFAPTGWVELDLAAAAGITRYALTSANDHAERDPVDWTLQGSADGERWTTLDTRSGESFSERFQTRTYDLAEKAEYQHFRLEFTRN
ncbi:discoidin domain-containing protein, partial [Streptomyces sp. TRM76130]|nr:discoidin domain-containing protein [Streptomyces sp. TRM76130]